MEQEIFYQGTHRHDAERVLVAQISRGLAPALSVADVARWATARGHGYLIVTGKPAVDAKNAAVDRADRWRASLLLCEDDLAPGQRLERLLPESADVEPAVRLLSATCRNGEHNTQYDEAGAVLYSGTVAVFLPRVVLDLLPRPIFECHDHTMIAGDLHPIAPNRTGHHSDVHLFRTLRHTGVPIRVVGHAVTLLHAFNSGGHILNEPNEIKELG